MVTPGSGSGSESVSQRYGSLYPDPCRNVKDPQHCFFFFFCTGLTFPKSYGHLSAAPNTVNGQVGKLEMTILNS
jgi:hypothetical protein